MKKDKDLSFEESINKLEEVVSELEKGELSLEDSVNKFKEGMELSTRCSKLLDDAEKSITILLKNSDGELEEKDFNV